ncbi:related to QDE3 protein (involved in gene silencing) [Cephalotrichum gorgonifer]|uniref:DNA 3'-5' helicase n=1 Tax=Cephalotrichum gorgonifer TaxID=2041049 RepID=A0AAE8MWR3_9PEZI|nr:related to QDE3 protein (involved in gene silencing) [Cephalotrichum gorgonifer]
MDEDDELMEITADEAVGSSDSGRFGTDVKLWNEDCASRPEPAPAKAKKRKSDEISRVWVSDNDDDDDEFPDLDELLSTPLAAPRVPVRQMTPAAAVAPSSSFRRATVEPPRTSHARSPGPVSPSLPSRDRTLSPAKSPVPSCHAESRPLTQQPLRTPVASPRKLPPVVLKPNALSPDTIQRALTRTPKHTKARRSSVVEETDDEFVTPSTGGGSGRRVQAGTAGLDDPITAIPCTFEASIPKIGPSPTRTSNANPTTVDQAQPRCAISPSRSRISPRKAQTSSSPPVDLQGLAELVEKPWPLQCRLDTLREELDQNRKAFEGALRESWPREKRDEIRKEKERLSGEQQVLKGLLDQTEAHSRLKKDVETLLQHISEAYMDGRSTDEDEDKLDRIQDEMKSKKQDFVEALSQAASHHPRLIAQVKAIPPQASNRIPQTQPPTSQSRQKQPIHDPFSSQVIHQTQLPEEPPRPAPYIPRDEPPPINPDDLEGMFSDLDSSPVQRKPPVNQAKAQQKRLEFSRNDEHDYFSDDEFDPEILALADNFSGPGPSTSSDSYSRTPLTETSGNTKQLTRPKVPTKRVASTASKNPFPPEQMQFPWSPEVKQMLKDRFRMEHFRHNQLEAINATLSGKDAFILMPTGGGKSLCYQLPAVVKSGSTKGITIVVSPLISLMQDQVDHLTAHNIHAVAYNGEASHEYKDMVMQMFNSPNPENYIELLYVTPEMVAKNQRFQDAMDSLYRKRKLARIVIDEAHCVSQWGHDFRPDYKQLGEVRGRFQGVPLMALTATATENVIVDVMHNLGMVDTEVFTQSFNRSNLYYEVRLKSGNPSALENIINLIQTKHANECGIVYTISRKSAEDVATKLREAGIKAAHYHASIESADKTETQRQWQADRIRVVVATIAFGMGIDKPDVRFVIHHGLPKSLEGYYQETGRAGRDGKPSSCYLFFSLQDARILRKLIHGGEGNWDQKQRQITMLNRMVSYCDNPADCRRVEVLRYFGEDFEKADCHKTCDNCRNGALSEQRDYTEVSKAAIEAVARQPRLTPSQCAEILMGKRAPAPGFDDGVGVEYYGIASDLKKHEVERIINKLSMEGALGEENKISNKAGFAIQYLTLGRNVAAFRYGRRRLTLPVQISSRGSKEPVAPKPKKRAKKDDNMRPPASTDISSPIAPRSRTKTPSKSAGSTGANQLELTRNGYERDDFVVDESDEDHFEPIPKRRKSNLGGTTILEDVRLDTLHDIHQEVIQNFVSEAKKLEESIRNSSGMRRPLFSEQNFQAMAAHWTATPAQMHRIRGIVSERVDKYGEKFAKLVKTFHQDYTEMMGLADDGDDGDMEVVDLISSDEDFDFDLDGDGGDPAMGEESRFFSAPERPPALGDVMAVQQWHQRLAQVSQNSAAREPSAPASGPRGRGKARGAGGRRGGARKFGGGASKRRASGGSAKAGSKAGSGARSKGGSSTGFQGKGGKGGGRGGGSSGIGLMPL